MSWAVSARHIPLTHVHVERTEAGLIARSTYWEIYHASYGATTVAALAYRQSGWQIPLWRATVYYVDRLLETIHPVHTCPHHLSVQQCTQMNYLRGLRRTSSKSLASSTI